MANTKKQKAYELKAIELVRERDAALLRAGEAENETRDLRVELAKFKSKNPFASLHSFVPDLDFEATGMFDMNLLTPSEQKDHLGQAHTIYNSECFNREISAIISHMQKFAIIEADVKGWELSKQCLVFIKGLIERFGMLSAQYDSNIDKKKKPIDRTHPIG